MCSEVVWSVGVPSRAIINQLPGREPLATGWMAKVPAHSQPQGPASLSKDGVELLGDVALLGVLPLLASAHHHIGVCFAIGVCRSQVGSLWGEDEVGLEETSLSQPKPLWDLTSE